LNLINESELLTIKIVDNSETSRIAAYDHQGCFIIKCTTMR